MERLLLHPARSVRRWCAMPALFNCWKNARLRRPPRPAEHCSRHRSDCPGRSDSHRECRGLEQSPIHGLPGVHIAKTKSRGLHRFLERTALLRFRGSAASATDNTDCTPPLAAKRFRWPTAQLSGSTVAQAIGSLMSCGGWPGADNWVSTANRIGPTIVGGSRLHGGADLGPSGARAAWARLKIDGSGIADAPPGRSAPVDHRPRLTLEMVARLQGWNDASEWRFQGSKTNQYRQIANAFPPPVAEAIGRSIACAVRAAAADSARRL